jgi:predicted  nucleic acid-binding Zn-ribbon protein
MSKNIDDVIKEVMKSNKEIHNMDAHISKDISELKKGIKNIENKIKTIENKLDQTIDLLNTFTMLLTEQDDLDIDDEDKLYDITKSFVSYND